MDVDKTFGTNACNAESIPCTGTPQGAFIPKAMPQALKFMLKMYCYKEKLTNDQDVGMPAKCEVQVKKLKVSCDHFGPNLNKYLK